LHLSSYVWTRVFLPIIIGFSVTFLFLFILFETLDLSEYVWPILFPILGGTFGLMLFTFCIVGLVLSKGCNVPSDQEMVQHAFYPPYSGYDTTSTEYPTHDSVITGAVYVIPLYCPHCMDKLELGKAKWIGSNELTCPSCYRVIQIGVRENF